jgi:hypothetical protein
MLEALGTDSLLALVGPDSGAAVAVAVVGDGSGPKPAIIRTRAFDDL